MGSGMEVERNDFKAVVEKFAHHMETVIQDTEDSVKTRQQKQLKILRRQGLKMH